MNKPESNTPVTPAFTVPLVTVCAAESSLIHDTVVPADTVIS